MKAEIITIGTELLLGSIDDTNATYIAAELNKVGIDVMYRSTVGDNKQRIANVVSHALDRVDVVLTTGGLGPTVDDVTRQGVAKATGRDLIFHQHLLDEIAEMFASRGYRLSDNNRRQAYIPRGATIIDNPIGTAPTFIVETKRGAVIVMPGVPREMRVLLETEMIPWIINRMETPAAIVSRTLRTAGIGESRIDEILGELMAQTNPTVGLAAHTGQTSVRIVAKATDEEAARMLIAPVEQLVRDRLGPWVYGVGEDTIEAAALHEAAKYNSTVAICEFDTDTILESRVRLLDNAAPLATLVTPPNGINETNDDWTQTALRLANHAKDEARATYGVGMVTGADGEDQIIAEMALTWDGGEYVRPFDWRFERADILEWAATHLFAQLRKTILEHHGVEFTEAR